LRIRAGFEKTVSIPFDPTRTQILRRARRSVGSPCPNCQVFLNYHVTPDGKDSNPAPGDATICTLCDSLLIFDADLRLRLPNEAEKTVMFDGLMPPFCDTNH
jgi:hypothetical protein